jgi:hypothetical protein
VIVADRVHSASSSEGMRNPDRTKNSSSRGGRPRPRDATVVQDDGDDRDSARAAEAAEVRQGDLRAS